jgi:hypothetical protein
MTDEHLTCQAEAAREPPELGFWSPTLEDQQRPLAHKFPHDHRRYTPRKVGRAGLVSRSEDRHESNAPKP